MDVKVYGVELLEFRLNIIKQSYMQLSCLYLFIYFWLRVVHNIITSLCFSQSRFWLSTIRFLWLMPGQNSV